MLLPDSDISCECSEVLQEYVFGVHDPGLIFEILRTKIYKDPITAIVREISCNSRDAHREIAQVKNDPKLALVPVEIALPNPLSPYIKFRDYGPGISPDRMEHVFCKYAASTKRNDNIQTGGFGLGCKTPFSYSDTFSIITVIDGVKRVYNAVIDETRVGKVLLNSESATTEADGTTIVVPVKREDSSKFIEAVIRTTSFWDVRPVLSGLNPLPQYDNDEKVLEGKGWYIAAGKTDRYGYTSNRTSLALVDGIQYDLDIASIYEYTDRYGSCSDQSSTLLQCGARINFGVGELTLSASRDNIHYDDKTKQVIKDRIKEIFKEIDTTLEAKITNAKTYTDACCASIQARNELPSTLRENRKLNWNDNNIRVNIGVDDINECAVCARYEKKAYAPEGTFTFSSTRSNNAGYLGWPVSYKEGKCQIYINDYSDKKDKTTPRISIILIQHLFNTNPNLVEVQVICIPPDGLGKTKDDLLKLLDFKKLSDLSMTKEEKEEVRKGAYNSLKKATGVEKDPDKINGHTFTWGSYGGVKLTTPIKQFDIDGDGVYVIVDTKKYEGKHISSNDKVIDRHSYNSIITFLKENIEVVAFSPQNAKKLGDGWKPLYEMAKEQANEMVKDLSSDDLAHALNNDNNNYSIKTKMSIADNYSIKMSVEKLTENTNISDDDCLIEYFNLSDKMDKLRSQVSALNNLKGFLDILLNDGTGTKKKSELETLYNKCFKKYPFLFMVDSYHMKYNSGNKAEKLVYEYVDLINKQ